MRFPQEITFRNFFTKLTQWEYWPFGIIQFPAILYWVWLSLRARSPVFFSASNPGIPMGGMFGESKYDVLMMIPEHLVPVTLIFHPPFREDYIIRKIGMLGLQWPLIFKPDIGERGHRVQRLDHQREIKAYIEHARGNFLVQECVRLPKEYGVFYMRMPGAQFGEVISVVEKEMLSVTGDGRSTLQQLILAKPRARLQWERLKVLHQDKLEDIVTGGEVRELVSIGNHALGTRFLDASHLINDRLAETFDAICRQIPGFYYGRFDLRCASEEDLLEGRVKIVELNGCGAEPGHIYDARGGLLNAMITPVVYWKHIYRIARANRRAGLRYVSLREGLRYYRKFKSMVG